MCVQPHTSPQAGGLEDLRTSQASICSPLCPHPSFLLLLHHCRARSAPSPLDKSFCSRLIPLMQTETTRGPLSTPPTAWKASLLRVEVKIQCRSPTPFPHLPPCNGRSLHSAPCSLLSLALYGSVIPAPPGVQICCFPYRLGSLSPQSSLSTPLVTFLQPISQSQVFWFPAQRTLSSWEEAPDWHQAWGSGNAYGRGREGEGLLGTSGLPTVPRVCGFMAVASSCLPGACLLGTQPKGQVIVLSILSTGTLKNPAPASQLEEDTASEEDQLPLQLLKSQ